MRRLLSIIFILAISISNVIGKVYSVSEIPNVHVADSTKFVSNPDAILSPATVDYLNSKIKNVWDKTSSEFVVVVVDDIDSGDIDDFATSLFNTWRIGKKDNNNGVLFIVAKDLRRAAIRTGYGAEGVLPDITNGKILRNEVFPLFKEGKYDEGVTAGVDKISEILVNPEYADELKSQYANNGREEESLWDSMRFYILSMAALSLLALLYVVVIYSMHRKTSVETYKKLNRFTYWLLIFTFLGLGIPLIAYLPAIWLKKHIRNAPHYCKSCGETMHKLDEASDNAYLDTRQDIEEQLNSVDYDVWLCPKCGETEILKFVNDKSPYSECPYCGAKACNLDSARIISKPTTSREGQGIKTYYCRHCRRTHDEKYSIAKLAAPVVVVGGSGRGFGGGGGFGGGFGGGSFGGGFTGGGGASGGW